MAKTKSTIRKSYTEVPNAIDWTDAFNKLTLGISELHGQIKTEFAEMGGKINLIQEGQERGEQDQKSTLKRLIVLEEKVDEQVEQMTSLKTQQSEFNGIAKGRSEERNFNISKIVAATCILSLVVAGAAYLKGRSDVDVDYSRGMINASSNKGNADPVKVEDILNKDK